MSKNHFEPSWSTKSYRRLKNVIVLMEVKAGAAKPTPGDSQIDALTGYAARVDTPRLSHAFRMIDADGSRDLNAAEALDALTSMDVFVDEEQQAVLPQWLPLPVDMAMFRSSFTNRMFYDIDNSRKYVLLSLHEAESLRGVLHRKQERKEPLLNGREDVSLSLISVMTGSVLDESPGHNEASAYQKRSILQSYRFLDCELYYNERDLNVVIRALQYSATEARLRWFEDVRECRRRERHEVEKKPVGKVFQLSSEFEVMEYETTVLRLRKLLLMRGMYALDAFRAFDSDRNIVINCAELYGALEWLGIQGLSESQVHGVMRCLDKDKDGMLNLAEFKAAFQDPSPAELQALKAAAVDAVDYSDVVIPPKAIRELYDTGNDRNASTVDLNVETVSHFKLKMKEIKDYHKIWTSQGSLTKSSASIWAGDLETSLLKQNRIRICLGHYVHHSFDKPGRGGLFSKPSNEAYTLEIKDKEHWGISGYGENMLPVLNKILPPPLRFKLVWSQLHGCQPIFIWKPIPPSPAFVSLGMLATTSEEPPAMAQIRCVPKHWCHAPNRQKPTKIWQDTGASGGRPGSVWIVNSLKTLFAVDGTGEPDPVDIFDLKRRVYRISIADIEQISTKTQPPSLPAKPQEQQLAKAKSRPKLLPSRSSRSLRKPPPVPPKPTFY